MSYKVQCACGAETIFVVCSCGSTRKNYQPCLCESESTTDTPICLSCAVTDRRNATKDFEDSLRPEQKELYEKYKNADGVYTSIIILD